MDEESIEELITKTKEELEGIERTWNLSKTSVNSAAASSRDAQEAANKAKKVHTDSWAVHQEIDKARANKKIQLVSLEGKLKRVVAAGAGTSKGGMSTSGGIARSGNAKARCSVTGGIKNSCVPILKNCKNIVVINGMVPEAVPDSKRISYKRPYNF